MTINQAFEQLTSTRAWYKRCNITQNESSSLKYLFKNGKLTATTMRRLLLSAGYVIEEKVKAPK